MVKPSKKGVPCLYLLVSRVSIIFDRREKSISQYQYLNKQQLFLDWNLEFSTVIPFYFHLDMKSQRD
jgi:hypothetical protein